jgi:protoporphyrinogen/coproporphyrinogen III oxidase
MTHYQPRIAIVGAGISGLTAAWYLQKFVPDAQVTLFDSNPNVGGVIQSEHREPFLIEKGADNFATLVPDALRFVQEMGIQDEFISPKRDHRIAHVVRNGKVVPIPNGFSLMQPTRLSSVLTTRALSMAGRIRLIGEYFVAARSSSVDESVESFAIRRLGRECFERLVEPIVGGIFTARAETLSMKAAMPQFLEMEQKYGGLIRGALAKRKSQSKSAVSARQAAGARYDQFLAPKRGMSWWLERIAQDLTYETRLATQITRLEKTDGECWNVVGKAQPESETQCLGQFEHLILALPSHRASQLLQMTNPKLASLLGRIPYASSAVAVLAVQRREIPKSNLCFGIVIPTIERRDSLAISLASEKYEGRCPDDLVLARVFMGGAVRPELLDKDDDALLSIARKEVAELLGATSPPVRQSLIRWPCAMPQYLVGHVELVQEIVSEVVQDPMLSLIGNAYQGVGIPQCVRMAREAAERIAGSISSTRKF